MQKNKLKIEDLGINGEGIAHNRGKTFFVPFALPGEEVEAEIVKENKNIVFAKLIKVLTASEGRIVPPCPYFEKCGGCDLQHMNYEKQLDFKQILVKNTIKKIAGIDAMVLPCERSENIFEYRNKISIPVSNGKLGLYEKSSHNIVEVKKCIITQNFNEKLINVLQNFLVKFKNETITHFVARFLSEKLLLTIVSKTKTIKGLEYLQNELADVFKSFGINININKKENAEILSNEFVHVFGEKKLEINEGGFAVAVSNKSFFQVNDIIRNKIYGYVCEKITGKNIIDAYSGVGILSSQLSKSAKKVFAIEIEKSACENAREILNKNKIKNVNVICGDCKIHVPKLCKSEKIDAVVLDPPRAGCSAQVLSAILKAQVPNIVYISCSAQTLARDIKVLNTQYKLESIKPFDMFPQTHHVECVACFKIKK